jgi:hypothetical protein
MKTCPEKVRDVSKSGSLDVSQPYGPQRCLTGIAYLEAEGMHLGIWALLAVMTDG